MATTDPASKSTFLALASYLNGLGLGSLFTLDSKGNPGGWLWQQIQQGVDTQDQLIVGLENTQAFKTRYKVIFELRDRAAKGEPVQVPTVGQVREYEDTVARTMRTAGMPTWFYDSYRDMHDLMVKGLSAKEVEDRIGAGWSVVRDADPAVREAFSQFYGVEGDAALAAFVLDPTKTQAKIEQAARAAYTSGYGRTIGVDINQTYAERIAQLPKTAGGIQQDLSQVSALSGVLTEGITETTDLTDQTALDAVAFGDGRANDAIQKRVLERQANARASSGGAVMTEAGLTGVRSS